MKTRNIILQAACLVLLAAMACSCASSYNRYDGRRSERIDERVDYVRQNINNRINILGDYMKQHRTIKPYTYSGLTGLTLREAEAELESFATGRHALLKGVGSGYGRRYKLRK